MRSMGKLTFMRVVLAAFFLFAAVLPLASMFAGLLDPATREVFASERFTEACLNSAGVALMATVISLALALFVAWALCRTNIKGKGAIAVVMTAPMLIPSLAHGMSLVFLFGSNGMLTRALGFESGLYGFWGIVAGSVLYAFPPAFLLIYDVLRYEDSSPYEAANILGIPPWRQFVDITLPYLRRPLIAAVFATFALVVTDYGVALTVGGKCVTLPVLMYQEVVGLLNFDTGIAIGFVLLIPAVVAFLVDVLNADKGKLSFVSRPFSIAKNRVRDGVASLIVALIALFAVMPVVAFSFVAFVRKYPVDLSFTLANIGRAFNMSMGEYWANSLFIACMVALIGTCLAYCAGYITARAGGRFSKALHLACITTLAVPGIVLGLSYMVFFKDTPIYGTFSILIAANLVHFFASPYLMAYNSLGKVNSDLESVGSTLGVSRASIVKDVIIPQTAGTIIEMFSYFFVNCMVTISAVAFLSTTMDMPLALLISDLDSQRLVECAALVSLVIFVSNVGLKAVAALAKRVVR